MTLTSTQAASAVSLNGNGVTTTFPWTYKAWDTDYIRVYLTLLSQASIIEITQDPTYDGKYTITLNPDGTGEVEYPLGGSGLDDLATGEIITIRREEPFEQTEFDVENNQQILAEDIEDIIDRTTALVGQLEEEISLTVRVPVDGTIDPDDYLEEIDASVDAAAASASAASTSETNAGVSETNAASSEAAAAASAASIGVPFTADRALQTDGSGGIEVSLVTSTELGYSDGLTGNIQDQIDLVYSDSTYTDEEKTGVFLNGTDETLSNASTDFEVSTDFVLEFSGNPDTITNADQMMDKQVSAGGFTLRFTGDSGDINFIGRDFTLDANWTLTTNTQPFPASEQWILQTIYDASASTVYITKNGTIVAEATGASPTTGCTLSGTIGTSLITTTNSLYIGSDNGSQRYFDGDINHAAFSDTIPATIGDVLNPIECLGYWDFNNDYTDSSGNFNDLTPVNMDSGNFTNVNADLYRMFLPNNQALMIDSMYKRSGIAWDEFTYRVPQGAKVYGSTDAITGGVITILDWPTEVYDEFSVHEGVTNPSRLTVPVGATHAQITFAAERPAGTTDTSFITYIYKNGAAFCLQTTSKSSSDNCQNHITTEWQPVTAGDYFEAAVDMGNSTSMVSDVTETYFAISFRAKE